ncbi:MAG: winged helix-turn-helix domain-containing protein [Dermabacter sp.]|nr:winged helix-turn-helix domain-containing protein [Dermabacter sp.]
MTIALDRPVTTPLTASPAAAPQAAARPARGRTSPVTAPPAPSSARVSITLTVDLPAATSGTAAQLADALRSQAQHVAAAHGGSARVAVAVPQQVFTEAPGQAAGAASTALPPRRGLQPVPLRPRKPGVVSPNAPARRDAESARLRLLQATAVSPSSPAAPGAPSAVSGLVIDLYGRRVRLSGEDVDLTHKEFELLAFLARHPREVVGRDQLMESVWRDPSGDTGERTVDVHIRRVRNKLGRYRKLISTVRGAGYRLDVGSDVAIIA